MAIGAGASLGLNGRGELISEAAEAIGNAAGSSYIPINCQQPFSFADITNGAAKLLEVGAAVGIGFSAAERSLTASMHGPANGRLSTDLEMQGLALGVGRGGSDYAGMMFAGRAHLDAFSRDFRRQSASEPLASWGGGVM